MKKEEEKLMKDFKDQQYQELLRIKKKHKKSQQIKQKKSLQHQRLQDQMNKKQLSQEKSKFVKSLLNLMGYEKSIKVYQTQIQELKRLKNPQDYSNSKSYQNKISTQKSTFQEQLAYIISNSINVQEILDKIQHLQSQGQKQIQNYSKVQTKKAQKFIRMLFPIQEHAFIPIYKNISIKFDKRRALTFDINDQDQFCILDDDSYLHLPKSNSQKRQLKIEEKYKILLLRWLSKEILLLINNNNKLYFYNSKLELLRIYKLQINFIQNLHLQIIKSSSLDSLRQKSINNKNILKLFIKNQKNKLIVNKINITNDLPIFYKPEIYDCNYSFSTISIIKLKQTHFQSKIKREELNFQQELNNKIVIFEHYYGLTTDSKSIIKFDTVVKKQGQIWVQQQGKIQSMKSSQCRFFLIILLSRTQDDVFSFYNPQSEAKKTKTCHYQIIKLNGNGSIIQRFNLQFQKQQIYKEIGFKKQLKISKIFVLKPDWLCCFSIQNKIIYFSNQSGKLLYIQQVEEKSIIIQMVKDNNSIIYSYDNHLKLLSLKEQDKIQYLINSKEVNQNDRTGLMLRLSRYGIPQTLLNLLRELRSNHIQLIQMP